MLGVERKDVMALGDNEEDISMLEWAGWGIAMPDSNEKTKIAANELSMLEHAEEVAELLRLAFPKVLAQKDAENQKKERT